MFRFCRLIIMSDSMKLKILSTKNHIFICFYGKLVYFLHSQKPFIGSRALTSSPSLGPSQKIEPEPSKNG